MFIITPFYSALLLSHHSLWRELYCEWHCSQGEELKYPANSRMTEHGKRCSTAINSQMTEKGNNIPKVCDEAKTVIREQLTAINRDNKKFNST